MKLFLLSLALWLASASAWGANENSLVGRWGYFMKVYEGVEMPEGPDATLRLRFEFTADGESHLYWWHVGEGDHCARRGRYRVENDVLVDEIVWVDPKNNYACAQDPDMQLGRVTRTPISFDRGNLVTHLHLGDDDLLYVWKRLAQGEE